MPDPRQPIVDAFKLLRDEFRTARAAAAARPSVLRDVVAKTTDALFALETQATKEASGARKFAEIGGAFLALATATAKNFPELKDEFEGPSFAFRSSDQIASEWDSITRRSSELRVSLASSAKADSMQKVDLYEEFEQSLDKVIEAVERRLKNDLP